MLIRIAATNEPQQIQVTTVTLAPDLIDPQGSSRIYMFHCCRCGSPVIRHAGYVVSIFPGLEPTQLPLLSKCKNDRCNAIYYFKSIVGK